MSGGGNKVFYETFLTFRTLVTTPGNLKDLLQVSPKSRNIWGTPSHDSQFRKPADALRKLFDTAKAGQRVCVNKTSTVTQYLSLLYVEAPLDILDSSSKGHPL